jgi:hypothetical protein
VPSKRRGRLKPHGQLRYNGNGGSASGFLLNAIDDNSIEERVAAVEADIGPIDTVVFNLRGANWRSPTSGDHLQGL